jgi:hypothetical protein
MKKRLGNMVYQLPYQSSAIASVADEFYKPFERPRCVDRIEAINMFFNTHSLFIWCLATLVEVEAASLSSKSTPIVISQCASSDAGIPLDSFMSFSFELSSWPDFAGMIAESLLHHTVR